MKLTTAEQNIIKLQSKYYIDYIPIDACCSKCGELVKFRGESETLCGSCAS